jgi:hypothetical protein
MERCRQRRAEILREEPAPIHFVHHKSQVLQLELRGEKPELTA